MKMEKEKKKGFFSTGMECCGRAEPLPDGVCVPSSHSDLCVAEAGVIPEIERETTRSETLK